MKAGLFATAILFGLVHMIPLQIVLMLFLGLYFGYLVLRTGSIWPAMLAHATNNVMALSVPDARRPTIDILIGVAALPVFALILWAIRRSSARHAAP
jgi:membrane protease YdiL (CAAX protease family)